MKTGFISSLVVTVLGCASFVSAAQIAVTNPGFEDITGETPYNEFTFGALNGWSLYDPTNATSDGDGPGFFIGTLTPFVPDPTNHPGVYSFFPAGAPEGERVAIAFNFRPTAASVEYGLQQTLEATLQPNTTYSLKVEVGNIASGTARDGVVYNLNGFPGYRVELLAGGVVVAQDANTLTPPDGTFQTSTVELVTGATHAQLNQPLGIRLISLNNIDNSAATADREVDFDNVRLASTPVPEPTGMAVVGFCVAACLSRPVRHYLRRSGNVKA